MDKRLFISGRGAGSNPAGRFEKAGVEWVDDGWAGEDEMPPGVTTVFTPDRPRSAINRNQSPDVPFDYSVNPYQGCEHGCIYCFARPSHAYWNLGPGLDFETRIFHKPGLAARLRTEISAPAYECKPINLGANTDPYQPAEREYRTTRELLEALLEYRHPVTIVTKGSLIRRDIDLLEQLAAHRLVSVMVSLTTLDPGLKRIMEPRASSPAARLAVVAALTGSGVPVGVLLAPVIPALNDSEIERLLESAAKAGAGSAAFLPLRLPGEVADLFEAWLREHFPARTDKVLNHLREMHGGRLNDPRFGHRMGGNGAYFALLRARFAAACHRFGLSSGEPARLDTGLFNRRLGHLVQRELFD
jgi:DNA repair photolyase